MMSRDEHPQYTPNVPLFRTPSHSFQPLWTTPNPNPGTPIIMGTGFQTYPAYLATPGPQNLQTPIRRSHKRKSDGNLGQSAPKKPRKGRSLGLLLDSTTPNLSPAMISPSPISRLWRNEELSAHLDVSDPDAKKLIVSLLCCKRNSSGVWTFGEFLYHSSKGKSPSSSY